MSWPPSEVAISTSPDPPVLVASGIVKRYGPTVALRGVDLALGGGEVHALVGGNGSGKSTLIKILAGAVKADSGQIVVDGDVVTCEGLTQRWAQAAGLRFVHQNHPLFDDLTVAENLAIGHHFTRGRTGAIAWQDLRRRAAFALEAFRIEARPETLVANLNQAARSMLAIARAMQEVDGVGPRVLILDEPTSSLPADDVELVLDAVQYVASAGHCVLLVTHRLEEVTRVADVATVLRDGQAAGQLRGANLQHDRMVELIVGGQLLAPGPPSEMSAQGRVVLKVSSLTAGSLRGCDLEVWAGELVGIAGLVGSGRSSLLGAVFGGIRPDGGRMELNGRGYTPRSPRAAMQSGVALVPEDRSLHAVFGDLSVEENIVLPALGRHTRLGLIRRKELRAHARDVIARYHVRGASEGARISSLSGGNQQKAIIGRALSTQPTLLLLDEPTQGVDIGARRQIWRLVRDAVSAGAAAVVVSSDFAELAEVCSRVFVLRGGMITDELHGSALSENALERLCYLPAA